VLPVGAGGCEPRAAPGLSGGVLGGNGQLGPTRRLLETRAELFMSASEEMTFHVCFELGCRGQLVAIGNRNILIVAEKFTIFPENFHTKWTFSDEPFSRNDLLYCRTNCDEHFFHQVFLLTL